MSSLFQTTLIQPLAFGQSLEIRAQAEQDATWFNISLTTGKGNNDAKIDIGLHMVVCITENIIAFKQCVKNEWKTLKSIEFDTIQLLESFKVNLIMDEQNFHIGINEIPCMYIRYGIPLEYLNTLKLNGHLKDIKQIDHRNHFPYFWPPIQLSENYIDFSNEQPIPFRPGHVIVIKMKLSGNDKGRLIIQFRNVWDINREELHMSIRFDTRKFILNSKLPKANSEDLEFGIEECADQFPFEVFKKPFRLAIALTETAFKIAKDGVFICDYAYRSRDVVHDLMGLKIFGIDGIKIEVFSVDHVFLNDVQYLDLENYSKIKYN